MARNLLERLWLGQSQVLAFLNDLRIPFDNNHAERDLRMFKTQQKMLGCFRSDAGAEAFARLRSFLSTLRSMASRCSTCCAHSFLVVPGSPLSPAFP